MDYFASIDPGRFLASDEEKELRKKQLELLDDEKLIDDEEKIRERQQKKLDIPKGQAFLKIAEAGASLASDTGPGNLATKIARNIKEPISEIGDLAKQYKETELETDDILKKEKLRQFDLIGKKGELLKSDRMEDLQAQKTLSDIQKNIADYKTKMLKMNDLGLDLVKSVKDVSEIVKGMLTSEDIAALKLDPLLQVKGGDKLTLTGIADRTIATAMEKFRDVQPVAKARGENLDQVFQNLLRQEVMALEPTKSFKEGGDIDITSTEKAVSKLLDELK